MKHTWTEHPDARQATKKDLHDIARAIGVTAPSGWAVTTLRAAIKEQLEGASIVPVTAGTPALLITKAMLLQLALSLRVDAAMSESPVDVWRRIEERARELDPIPPGRKLAAPWEG